jgi:hypothetical protein
MIPEAGTVTFNSARPTPMSAELGGGQACEFTRRQRSCERRDQVVGPQLTHDSGLITGRLGGKRGRSQYVVDRERIGRSQHGPQLCDTIIERGDPHTSLAMCDAAALLGSDRVGRDEGFAQRRPQPAVGQLWCLTEHCSLNLNRGGRIKVPAPVSDRAGFGYIDRAGS